MSPRARVGAGVIEKDGRRLTTLEEWQSYAPPKRKMHWKNGRSAKENARLWLGASPDLPSGIVKLLRAGGCVGTFRSWSAEPESRVSFDALGEPANLDLVVHADDEHGPVVMGVEAKADEPFGPTVKKTQAAAQRRLAENPRSKGVERIRGLATTFGLDLDRPEILELRYQLLTLTAATVAEARRQSAERAVVIVQEFVSRLTKAENRARNARDLDYFLETVFGHTGSVGPGTIAGAFRMGSLGALYWGKTETNI